MRHYCTLFDSKYLPQGLVLHESLKRHSSEEFRLHVLALDDEAYHAVCELAPECGRIGIQQFLAGTSDSDSQLRTIRNTRTWQEFCWTLASQWAEEMLKRGVDEITYLDADIMFFSDPKVIHDEIGERSIAVIPHRFIPSKQYLDVNGKFNVSWVTFKNNSIGRECLSTWAAQCREKCSLKDGCGDQKYLDAWPQKYGHELCVIENIGAGLAPWNLANYGLTDRVVGNDDGIFVYDLKDCEPVPAREVVFYHYHEYLHGQRLTNYELRQEDIKFIYEPYIQAVTEAKAKIETISV